MPKTEPKRFVADFETTTDVNDCRVWAYAICSVDAKLDFQYGNCIEDFFEWCANPNENYIVLFHNLKFDSSFCLSYLNDLGFKHISKKEERADKTYETLISDMGAYYSITVYFTVKGKKVNKVTFLDSMKIFNMSVEKIAESFKLPISKLTLDYKKFRKKGHKLTKHEIDYIRNDVEIVARALHQFYSLGYTKMTIGSNALTSYKKTISNFKKYFPELEEEVDKAIRKAYRGGFTCVNPKIQGKIVKGNLICADVNSLYPSRMTYMPMPYGEPVYFEGKYQEDKVYNLYTQRILCTFKVKHDKIPTIQIKNNSLFISNEYLESSGSEPVELTLTNVDLKLFLEHYDVDIYEWIDGYKIKSAVGLFTNYYNYWSNEKGKAKKEHNDGLYKICKIFANSLYGKYASAIRGKQKIPVFDDMGVLHYIESEEEEMSPVYLPVACWTTSYGRDLTIRSAQAIREWSEKNLGYDAWCYCDTDSIYARLTMEQVEEIRKQGILEIDSYKLGAWDIEETAISRAKFLRQKCYIKEVDGKIKATVAGCPKNLSRLFTFKNFDTGFTTAQFTKEQIGKDAKLRYKQVKGGVILTETDFTIK